MSEEQEAIKELMLMSQEELDLVPYETKKLICQAKGCNRHTKARDYGLEPVYYVKALSSKKDRWHNRLTRFFLCSKHWKMYQRLIKNFDKWRVEQKIMDYDKQNLENL